MKEVAFQLYVVDYQQVIIKFVMPYKRIWYFNKFKKHIKHIADHKKASKLYTHFGLELLQTDDPYHFENEMDISEKIHGLLCDIIYLTGMESHIILKKQKGISVWTMGADQLDKFKDIEINCGKQQMQKLPEENRNKIPNRIESPSTSLKSLLESDSNLKRELCCSRVYHHNDPDLINVLCTAIFKMKACLIDALETSSSLKSYQVIDSTGSLLISRLGSGRDGYVWKETTVNRNLTVVKFFNNTFTKEKVEKETVIWKNAWDITTLSVSMNNYQCLLMPFLKIVDEDEDDWKDHRFLKLVELACLRFARAGYKHLDLKRRHVARHSTPNNDRVVVFIDLSSVDPIDPLDIDAVSNEMYQTLIDEGRTKDPPPQTVKQIQLPPQTGKPQPQPPLTRSKTRKEKEETSPQPTKNTHEISNEVFQTPIKKYKAEDKD
ncbi:hypothetical protein DDB_G0274397 [Dictyostelium discoideum AX4]|uniref:DUF5898 domain-containing protein n=1 Tax=Dictyostelium discoideum TaxID=44689 RepID=Q86KA9_DICDI|nr:hypothetical protein DDB_G0274397 [Dictyostelium discoideum AX4]EAL70091.1 hypothetical protein DDB_G0274397 [Dictyostelium discoideum AX4]|eukprot:XP_644232.1 hypothetical protein DDB_G0274397 [Dictyostelium discoideum AX4]